jgi:hypothetical protein
MKKKSPRGIPDFSSKGPKSGFLVNRNAVPDQKPQKPATPAPKVKPPATSSKSGRRGG